MTEASYKAKHHPARHGRSVFCFENSTRDLLWLVILNITPETQLTIIL